VPLALNGRPGRRWLLGLALAGPAAWLAWHASRGVPSAAPGGPWLRGHVEMAQDLRAQLRQDDTVLIFALVVDGPRTPVAQLTRRAAELPLDFELNASHAVTPGFRLSPSTRLVAGARIVAAGQGDGGSARLLGYSKPVATGAEGVAVVIQMAPH
jgi:cytochrome c-type biogenesis protein CcmH